MVVYSQDSKTEDEELRKKLNQKHLRKTTRYIINPYMVTRKDRKK